nr:unnamed protein product [Digitaria exilis]
MCLDGHYVAGLYRHSSSGEYRVLYRMGASYPAVDAPYYSLTVGSDAKPRCVGLLSASASIKQDVADHVPPTNENSSRGSRRHLLEMDDGTLGVSYIDERKMTVKLWVLKDYEAEFWSLKYEIELRTVEMRSVDQKCNFMMVVGGGGFGGLCEQELDVEMGDRARGQGGFIGSMRRSMRCQRERRGADGIGGAPLAINGK